VSERSEIATRRAIARRSGDADYQQRRLDLVRAAATVFRRVGFQAANLLEIAKEAGMDRASVYYYVSGKEEIYHGVVLSAVQQNVWMVEGIAATRATNAPAKLATLVELLMHSYEEHYPYLFVYVQENMAHFDAKNPWQREMRALGERFDDAVTTIIQDGLTAGTLKPIGRVQPRLLAYALLGMCNWSHRWFNPKGKLTGRQIGAAFAEVLLGGIASSESGNRRRPRARTAERKPRKK
jgi:AcrR family transcriptional regulator